MEKKDLALGFWRIFLGLWLLVPMGHAVCSSPAGVAGEVFFNTTYNVMQYCNGTNWMNTGTVSQTVAQTGCSSPVGVAGNVFFNETVGMIQFCNGSQWVDTACATDRTPGGSGCSSPTGAPGAMLYASGQSEMIFCDSTQWVAMGYPCVVSAGIDWSGASEVAKLLASDGGDWFSFGTSIGISGDTAAIGAHRAHSPTDDEGAVYVFTLSGGSWGQQAKLVANDAQVDDYMGSRVSIDSNTVVVGAASEDAGGNNAGAAYVFTRSGTSWTQQAKLMASDAAADDRFGIDVSLSGDTAIVGASLEDEAASNAGAAYVFTRSGTNWTQQAKLMASDAAADDYFGFSVAVDGDTAVVGAYYETNSGGSDAGAAYVFTRSGTNWTQQAKLVASDGAASDNFGEIVDIDGNTIVVSARRKNSSEGAIYVFTGGGASWTQQAKLTATDGASDDWFGQGISIHNDVIAVGARGHDAAASRAGTLYLFQRSGTSWSQVNKLFASDAAVDDFFGHVALEGEILLIGADSEDTSGNGAGAVYFFSP